MSDTSDTKSSLAVSWRVRLAIGVLMVIAVIVISVTNKLLTDRFTDTTRNRAELRIALYSG
ncbi:MAG: sensor histidine kinase, partial [Sulfitobacter sp.]|nr:sensor histidine kinase [Sulfitobacter sp.]